ncbi:hypothetical protein ABPG74_011185 [Tetrahymena malaccensis]
MDFSIEEHPQNLILPIELTKIIYSEYDAELTILDKPGQVYGKALHGQGKIKFKNGNTYEGELDNGMLHGKGKFRWANGVIYEGQFEYNTIKGVGTYQWPDTSTYTGQVLNGLRHGQGTFVSPEGEAEYTGSWVEGLRNGNGTIKFKSGAVFEGQFVNGCKHGHGRMTYPSGNYYEGEWKYDKKDGQGTMIWLNSKEKYYGQWRNNLQNGFGVHIWLESKGEGKLMRNRYEGQWVDGQRHGYGVFYYANGSKYEGEWRNNLKEGYAIFTEDNGNLIQGQYKADRLVKQENNLKTDLKEQQSQHEKDKQNLGATDSPSKAKAGKDEKNKQAAAATTAVKLKTQTKINDPKEVNSSQQMVKKKEIEMNPYIYLVDFFDMTQGIEEGVLQIHQNIQTMLLRHNSDLRNWYKIYSNNHENTIGEDAFSMDMLAFWKMMKEAKVTDQTVTLASINRLFYQGVKNRYTINSQEQQIQKQIEIAKKLGRPLTQEELRDIVLLDLIISKTSSEDKLDYSKLGEQEEKSAQDESQLYLYLVDVHDSKRAILYRHFVELIVRMSYLKYGDIQNVHRSLEKFIQSKIAPIFESKKLPSKSFNNLEDTDSGAQKKKVLVETYQDLFKNIYNSLAQDNKNPKYGMIDKTIKFKDILKYLQDCELVQNDQEKKLLMQIFEKTFDPTSTVQYVDQMQKEKEKEDKERERKELKDKKKKAVKQQEQNKQQLLAQQLAQSNNEKYEKLKVTRQALIYETEMLLYEVEELISVYLLKKEKDLSTSKDDNDLIKKSKKYFDQLSSKLIASKKTLFAPQPKKQRFWPYSIKDKLKEQLALERVRKEEADKAKKLREEEKKRETRERAKMALEDYDINSDLEFANQEDDDEYDDY